MGKGYQVTRWCPRTSSNYGISVASPNETIWALQLRALVKACLKLPIENLRVVSGDSYNLWGVGACPYDQGIPKPKPCWTKDLGCLVVVVCHALPI